MVDDPADPADDAVLKRLQVELVAAEEQASTVLAALGPHAEEYLEAQAKVESLLAQIRPAGGAHT